MIIITREIAQKVRDVVDAGLVTGVGVATPGKMCVEAAVCYALGLPHGDNPGCVSPALRHLKIRLNDSRWVSDTARARGLRRLAVAQLGSKDALDDREFARLVAEMTIRRLVPLTLRMAASKNPKYSVELEFAAVRCETEGTRDSAISARDLASADKILSNFAEWVVEILIQMNAANANVAPGCQWLDLVPLEVD